MMFNDKYLPAVAGLAVITLSCELYTSACVAADREPLSTRQYEALKPHVVFTSADSIDTTAPIFQVYRKGGIKAFFELA